MGKEDRTVFVFSTHDVSTVVGTTEAYYVAKHLSREYDTHVFAPTSSRVATETRHRVPGSGVVAALLLNTLVMFRVAVVAARRSPDVVYCYRNVVVPPIVFGLLTDADVVYDFRVHPVGQPEEFTERSLTVIALLAVSRAVYRAVLSQCDHVIALSQPLAEQIASDFGLDRDGILVVPLAADVDRFTPVESDDDRIRVVYLGTINERRGVHRVMDALVTLDAAVQSQIRLDLVGPGDEEYVERFREAASDSRLEFVWHGMVPHEDVPETVGRCDIAVSPLPDHDSYEVSSPAKLYEYLALGLPVIATRIAPHERILSDGENATLVTPDDPTEMGDAVRRLVVDEAQLTEMSATARRHAVENDWENRVDDITAMIDPERGREQTTDGKHTAG
jgi:glycosyltransferase involved in cell wall biosynthesis